jgi:Flp pilus assembly protein TadG
MERKRHGEAGQVLPWMIAFLAILLLMAGAVVDIGQAYRVRIALQASTDAAALAGASKLPDSSAARATAQSFSGEGGAKNEITKVGSVSATITTSCSSAYPGCRPDNTVAVQQTAKVGTSFLGLIGINDITITTKSSACAPCGARPLDVVVLLDRTGSMCTFSDGTYDASCTDLNNAKDGIRTFLGLMDPSANRVALGLFPPATSTGARCSTPSSAAYNSQSSAYIVVPFSTDYRVSGSQGLNSSSNLVQSVNCIQAGGSTAYATALEKAQAYLQANGRQNAQKVIVMMSDGAANTGPTYYSTTSPYRRQPCQQGVNSAATIKAQDTVIYTIGYDLDAQGANVCQSYTGALESPSITAQYALQQIASPGNFYNHPSASDLSAVFSAVAYDINAGTARLID